MKFLYKLCGMVGLVGLLGLILPKFGIQLKVLQATDATSIACWWMLGLGFGLAILLAVLEGRKEKKAKGADNE